MGERDIGRGKEWEREWESERGYREWEREGEIEREVGEREGKRQRRVEIVGGDSNANTDRIRHQPTPNTKGIKPRRKMNKQIPSQATNFTRPIGRDRRHTTA